MTLWVWLKVSSIENTLNVLFKDVVPHGSRKENIARLVMYTTEIL